MGNKTILGSCCNCGREDETVRSIIEVARRSPEPGIGCWGCVTCSLEQAGAIAVLCDTCMDMDMEDLPELERICLGPPSDNRRIPIDAFPFEPFGHDASKHDQVDTTVFQYLDDDSEEHGNPDEAT